MSRPHCTKTVLSCYNSAVACMLLRNFGDDCSTPGKDNRPYRTIVVMSAPPSVRKNAESLNLSFGFAQKKVYIFRDGREELYSHFTLLTPVMSRAIFPRNLFYTSKISHPPFLARQCLALRISSRFREMSYKFTVHTLCIVNCLDVLRGI